MNACNFEIIKLRERTLLLNLNNLGLSLMNTTSDAELADVGQQLKDISREKYLEISRQLYNQQKSNQKLAQISIIVTYACNFNCQYCYQQHLEQRETKIAITPKFVDTIFDYCKDREKTDKFSIHLSGGEPLLVKNKKFVTYILERAKQEGYKVLITTNGYTLTEYTPILKKYAANIGYINISIDGPDPIHAKRRRLNSNKPDKLYSVNKLINGMKDLAGQIRFCANTLVDAQNIQQLPEIMEFIKVKLLEPKLVNRVRIAPVTKFQTNYKNDIEETFFEQMSDYFKIINDWDGKLAAQIEIVSPGCSKINKMVNAIGTETDKTVYPEYGCTSATQLTFDPFGDIYLCELFAGEKKMKLGTYYPEYKMRDYYESFQNRSPFTIEKCKNCKYVFICGSGCMYFAFLHNGDPLLHNCTGFTGRYKDGLFNIYLPQLLKMKKILTEDDLMVGGT